MAERWRDGLRVAPGTVRNRISIVRTFFEWCVDQGHCKSNPLAGMRSPKEPRRLPRGLSAGDVAAVLGECDDERARLMVLLECQEMLRAKEVAGLQFGDINRIEHEIRVVGKGGHERVVPVSDETWTALGHYLATYPAKSGPLIRSFKRPDLGIGPPTVVRIVSAAMKSAGVNESGHALRHTGATDMLRNGADIVEVRDALGHLSIATTQRYLGVTQATRLREAMGGRRYGELRGEWRGDRLDRGDRPDDLVDLRDEREPEDRAFVGDLAALDRPRSEVERSLFDVVPAVEQQD